MTLKHVPASSKLGKQIRSANSGAAKERNKYAPKVDPNRAAKRAAWNAELDRKMAARKGAVWKWQLNNDKNGMVLVDRGGKHHHLQWAEYPSNPPLKYVGCQTVQYPVSIAVAENVAQTAGEIVDRIVAYLNANR